MNVHLPRGWEHPDFGPYRVKGSLTRHDAGFWDVDEILVQPVNTYRPDLDWSAPESHRFTELEIGRMQAALVDEAEMRVRARDMERELDEEQLRRAFPASQGR